VNAHDCRLGDVQTSSTPRDACDEKSVHRLAVSIASLSCLPLPPIGNEYPQLRQHKAIARVLILPGDPRPACRRPIRPVLSIATHLRVQILKHRRLRAVVNCASQ
jgi:hypothetical protein